jgi:hypothetical protein
MMRPYHYVNLQSPPRQHEGPTTPLNRGERHESELEAVAILLLNVHIEAHIVEDGVQTILEAVPSHDDTYIGQ